MKTIVNELSNKFKHITKLNTSAWKVQSNLGTMCNGFYVNLLPQGIIVMSGDYGGLMLRPYGNEKNLIGWLASATTLSYFVEKVHTGNEHHKCSEYSLDEASNCIKHIRENYVESQEEDDNAGKKFDDFVKYDSLETAHDYYELISKIETEFDLYDLYEYNPEVYTDIIKWQHKCLIFFANKVLQDESSISSEMMEKNEV